MNFSEAAVQPRETLSKAGRRRLLSRSGEPFLIAAWKRALMIHFEVDTDALQRDVPYELDLWDGRAFISLVAFTMRGMKSRIGGRLSAWLFRPIGTHDFLNVRTYVRHNGETGIHFLAEWLSSWMAVQLGPVTFGLPYRHGRIEYEHDWEKGELRGRVEDVREGLALEDSAQVGGGRDYETGDRNVPRTRRLESLRHVAQTFLSAGTGNFPVAQLSPTFDHTRFSPCEHGSLDEWLMERYTAFNSAGNRKRFFRVWHPPWPQCPVNVELHDISLLRQNWRWFGEARLVGASFSPGFGEVWMGRPHRIKSQ